MVDVFLSYSRADKDRAQEIVDLLSAEGWDIWWDPEIVAGSDMDDYIADRLDSARCVVVLWSENSVKSRWVRGEARIAADRGILVPARIGRAQPPIDLRAIQTIDLVRNNDNINDLIRGVGLLVGRGGDGDDAVQAAELRNKRRRSIQGARNIYSAIVGGVSGALIGSVGALAGLIIDYQQKGEASGIYTINQYFVELASILGILDVPLWGVLVFLLSTFGLFGAYVYAQTKNRLITGISTLGLVAIFMMLIPPDLAGGIQALSSDALPGLEAEP